MHIKDNERRVIAEALKRKKSLRTIAKRLGRSVSTISDEIHRNSVKGIYDPRTADGKAHLRRRQSKQQCLKVAMDPTLKAYITEHVETDQNPEAISARLKNVDTGVQYVSTKAIYAFVHSVHGRKIERHLYTKRVKRHGGRKRGSAPPGDATKKRVTERPTGVENRTDFGHFEGDFIESGRDGTGSILVLVERKTRYPFLVYTEDKSTLTINMLLATTLRNVPVQSVTLDNDIAFQKHEALSELIDATVYFTHAYASHEKGTVENRNRAVREYIPKRSDISQYRHVIDYAQAKLRTRFMVVLKGLSPEEVWVAEMKKHAKSVRRKKADYVLKGKPSVRFEG
jgi:IS30 family transposase